MHQQSSETVMARYLEARTGHELAIAALFASLLICLTAAPALAQSVPLPTPRPAINAHPTGSIAAPARPAVPSAALGADDVFVIVVVEEKNGVVGTSRLMIMFNAKDMQLKQWTVTDPQGYDTTVAVYNLDTSKRPNPDMFKIDYTNYHN